MTTIIIEDEKLAAERLQLLLHQVEPGIAVKTVIDTTEDCVRWLKTNQAPDFILMDIHLADGSAFEIFRQLSVIPPVIFTTAYDQYALEAFKVLSVDYLLKPITADALTRSIQKLQTLRNPVQAFNYEQLYQLLQKEQQKYKTRFIGKVGQKLFFIDAAEVAYFIADNKIVYLCEVGGNQYIIEYTLEMLEKVLDPKDFFRVNRSVIVSARGIEQVKPYFNSRLKIICKSGQKKGEAIISREKVNDFKRWADS